MHTQNNNNNGNGNNNDTDGGSLKFIKLCRHELCGAKHTTAQTFIFKSGSAG